MWTHHKSSFKNALYSLRWYQYLSFKISVNVCPSLAHKHQILDNIHQRSIYMSHGPIAMANQSSICGQSLVSNNSKQSTIEAQSLQEQIHFHTTMALIFHPTFGVQALLLLPSKICYSKIKMELECMKLSNHFKRACYTYYKMLKKAKLFLEEIIFAQWLSNKKYILGLMGVMFLEFSYSFLLILHM